jgi:riboflavin kinase/FMN adenylyltransferase
MHLGHQFLVHELVQWARTRKSPAVVMTFTTHPRSVVERQEVRRLMPTGQKLRLLESLGVDAAIVMEFGEDLRALTAREFCTNILRCQIGAAGLLLGHNNRLGRDRLGTHEALTGIGGDIGLEVRIASRVDVDGLSISSSAIREHIGGGDFLWARKMLGRPYTIRTHPVPGRQLGRTIGFPTFNLPLVGLVHPPRGVYGVRVTMEGPGGPILPETGVSWIGAANIGVRPTVDPARTEPLLEVHLITNGEAGIPASAFAQTGQLEIEVEFVFRVRNERKFDSVEHLRQQLANDIGDIKSRFEEGEGGEAASEHSNRHRAAT